MKITEELFYVLWLEILEVIELHQSSQDFLRKKFDDECTLYLSKSLTLSEISLFCEFIYDYRIFFGGKDCDMAGILLTVSEQILTARFVCELAVALNNDSRWSLWDRLPTTLTQDVESSLHSMIYESILDNCPSNEDLELISVHKP